MNQSEPTPAVVPPATWKPLVSAYQQSHAGRASWQLISSIVPYLGLWVAIWFLLDVSWWLVLPLILLAGAFLVRIFILFHDCGHGSFFKSRRANHFWGILTGLLAWTPYDCWRSEHATHHATSGNLDKRGVGDFWTLTVREYLEAPWWRRFAYRLARNPVVLLGIAPLVMFILDQRRPKARSNKMEIRSVWLTNFLLAGMVVGLGFAMGFWTYLILQMSIMAIAGGLGIWLFYSQHQFEDVYWERGEDWDYGDAAFRGSAFLKLPRVLQWFTGNIGFHHLHHLSSRIPNYNLQACHESHPMFRDVTPMNFWGAVRSLGLKLWDEAGQKLIHFRELKDVRRRGYA
jgi:omega-6 fatty acid desaturase (delta-12 desaturase)